jgi:hypothetical protein
MITQAMVNRETCYRIIGRDTGGVLFHVSEDYTTLKQAQRYIETCRRVNKFNDTFVIIKLVPELLEF